MFFKVSVLCRSFSCFWLQNKDRNIAAQFFSLTWSLLFFPTNLCGPTEVGVDDDREHTPPVHLNSHLSSVTS